MLPFWNKISDFFRQRTIVKTKSYTTMMKNRIEKNRAKNKVARKSRRVNQLRSK